MAHVYEKEIVKKRMGHILEIELGQAYAIAMFFFLCGLLLGAAIMA